MDTQTVDSLRRIGFRKVTTFRLVGNCVKCKVPKPFSFEKNVIYIFVLDGVIVYVGQTVRTLAARMQNYCTPGSTQITNLANNERISAALEHGKIVEVWSWCPTPAQGIRSLDDAEHKLISKLRPLWNSRAKEWANLREP